MYDWTLQTDTTTYEGRSATLNDALDRMVKHANGRTERDFHVNGHNMNEEFGLWIDGGKVIHDDGTEFVAMNEWYDKLAPKETATGSPFRPQPTRGSAPANVATLLAKGIDL